MELYDNLCHICNTIQENLVSVHDAIVNANEEMAAPRSLRQMLEYCLQLSLDELVFSPQVICFPCVKHLQISYQFIKGFHQVQQEYCLVEDHESAARVEANDSIACTNALNAIESQLHAAKEEESRNEPFGEEIDNQNSLSQHSALTEDDRTVSMTTDADIITIGNDDPLTIVNNQDLEMNGLENVEYWIVDNKNQYGVGNGAEITTTTSVMVNYDNNHELNETNMPQQECDICAKRFFTQRALQLHLKITHKVRNHENH